MVVFGLYALLLVLIEGDYKMQYVDEWFGCQITFESSFKYLLDYKHDDSKKIPNRVDSYRT